MKTTKRLFCFGLGYSAEALIRRLKRKGWTVAGTCREEKRRAQLARLGIKAYRFDGERPLNDANKILAGVTHLLISIPPSDDGAGAADPVLRHHLEHLLATRNTIKWIGYLSSTSVYGDARGLPVDEDWPCRPTSMRSQRRIEAESAWRALARGPAPLPVHAFRLAGIYGPGRSELDRARAGTAKRIDRPRHRFARIHVDDIASVLMASIVKPRPGAIYNVCDDEPAPPSAVTEEACRLLKVSPPPFQFLDEALKSMSPMARGFWRDYRFLLNFRIKSELKVKLVYPDFRAGLKAILKAGG
ncbi:MAG: SDR family oxidoreductase [Rhodospirillales bacterium]|nr:SDR family oxidoreductase [Rhodospirillales bacterium]MSP79662.1 SDR family oxidoreductase [Rhodospirillales bacterium]